MLFSSLDLAMGGVPMGGHHQPFGGGGGLSLDLDLLSGAGLGLPSSDMLAMHPPVPVTDAEHPLMARMAAQAMDNSIYSKLSSSNFRAGDIRVEGSQDTAVVCMSPVALLKVFMDDSIYSQASCPMRGSLTSSSMYDVSVAKVMRIHRQRHILKQRLKMPPTLHQFTRTLYKNLGTQDYNQQRPSQELVAKDLHGTEWKFRHIYRV
ncbi:hypothetical protein ZWY2020_020411 [Hordeum vulgare]|nr:hypothetical protein ZWY2020_020411 [Hordeum vulgare]